MPANLPHRFRPCQADNAHAITVPLQAHLAADHEPGPTQENDLQRRLEEAVLMLKAAGAVEPDGEDRFHLTTRGVQLLAEHPDGVDQSVLRAFPAFRAAVAGPGGGTRDGPRLARVQPWPGDLWAGAADQRQSIRCRTSDHLAWERGWSEARDAGR
jgi:hypothetical protein